MAFNSPQFGAFFIVFLLVYWAATPKWRWLVLFAGSAAFYASWNYRYLAIVLFVASVAYAFGRLSGTLTRKQRSWLLAGAIGLILAPLVFFKYADFLAGSAQSALSMVLSRDSLKTMDVVLPLGISFYTFQLLSYCIDVHGGRIAAVTSLPRLILYPLYFPHQIAGPIVRPSLLLPQFTAIELPSEDKLVSGMRLFLWGLFKKVFVADRLSVLVDGVYAHPGAAGGLPSQLAFYFFAFQIYCDFSGYTDMAIGVSRIMGIELCENFRQPYFATSVREFWSRWHISLSTWFRDYLYIPLGGARVAAGRWLFNIMLVFTVSGLWHGANWTFVLWGAYHGVMMILERGAAALRERMGLRANRLGRLGPWLRGLVTFHLVCIGWVLFRAPSLGEARQMLADLTALGGTADVLKIMPWTELLLSAAGIVVVLAGDLLLERRGLSAFQRLGRPLRWAVYYAAIVLIVLFPGSIGLKPFIYFQF